MCFRVYSPLCHTFDRSCYRGWSLLIQEIHRAYGVASRVIKQNSLGYYSVKWPESRGEIIKSMAWHQAVMIDSLSLRHKNTWS